MVLGEDSGGGGGGFAGQLAQFCSAKLKIDELFNEFLCSEGSETLLAVLQEAAQERRGSSGDGLSWGSSGSVAHSALSSSSGGISSGSVSGSTSAASPVRPLLSKKSPKKRPQSEMSSSLSPSSSSSSSSSLAAKDAGVSSSALELSALSLSGDKPSSTSPSSAIAAQTMKTLDKTPLPPPISQEKEREREREREEHSAMRRKATLDKIPIFYCAGRRNYVFNPQLRSSLEEDKLSKRLPEIEAFFKPFPGGIPVEKFVHVTKRLCGIPSFFNLPLCRRINEQYGDAEAGIPAPRTIGRAGRTPSGVRIKLKSFLKFWQSEIEPYDRVERFFRVIKKHDAEFIVKDDFIPFLQELLHFHPGLDFLEQHEEFQRKYALTVITRIFYKVNTSRTGSISLREVRKSNLFTACMHVDEETDINKVLDYFSYEHFYVIYCKFFELDADKDSKLTKQDLMKYGDHALTEAIVDRIFQVGVRVFSDGQLGGFEEHGMTYPDFIFFMLSEEDKTTDCALNYWFRCCDLDGDGKLSPEEMRYFYRNQIHRITNLGQESINFLDVLCQMMDMVAPAVPTAITIEDLIRPDKRMISGVLFDVLFNLHKFMRFESRDPFQEKLRREDVAHTDWDRYAHMEYNRLAQEEEEGYDASLDQQALDQQVGAGDGALNGEIENWSLHDEEEESEDEDDSLMGNRIAR